MFYKYKCGNELIKVFVWNNEFHSTVSVEDAKTRKSYERTIREDENGKFFTWNRNKIYLNDWVKISMRELKEKIENEEFVTSDDLCQAIMTDGIENVRFTVPLNAICGFGFLLNGNEFKDTLCKVEERPLREVKNNYKIVLVPVETDESVASIDKDGLITAFDRGTTVITATAVDGSEKTTSFTLTVKKYVSVISLDKEKLTLYVGERGTVKQTVLPEDANDRSVIWQSSDPGVATVSSGTITGVKAGTITITCTARDGSNISKTCEVTVIQQISSIVLAETNKTVNVGDKFVVNTTINPEDAASAALKWTSSSDAVATVNENGEIVAKGRGTATITCEAAEGIEGRKAKATLRLTVNQPVTGIKLNQTKLNLFVGKQGRITSTVVPANANNRNVEWTTSNSKVATVNNGTITAVSKGTAVITCKAKDGSGKLAKCTVTVSQPVTSIKLNATNKTIKKGATFTLKATVGPAAANNKAVTWSSSNTKVATVSSTGVVKAVGKGSAVITCKSKDGSNITAKCTINSVIMVSSIKLNKKTATIKRRGKITLRATVGPATANNKAVTWVSSNKKIATVTTSGTVVGKKKGRVVIKCKAKDGSGKYAKCTIIVK